MTFQMDNEHNIQVQVKNILDKNSQVKGDEGETKHANQGGTIKQKGISKMPSILIFNNLPVTVTKHEVPIILLRRLDSLNSI